MNLKNPILIPQIILLCCVLWPIEPATGQDEPKDTERASMMFEFDFKQIRDCKFIQMFGLNEFVEAMGLSEDELGLDPLSVDRWYAAFDWPEDAQEIVQFQGNGDFPVSFIWVVEFNKPGAGNQLKDQMAQFFANKEIDGVTYYYPEDAPNLLFQFDDTCLTAGSANYVLCEGDYYSPALRKLVDGMPDSPVRGAIDVKSAKPFLDSIMDMPDEDRWMFLDIPRELMQAFMFYRNIDAASLSINPDGPDLITMTAQSESIKTATRFNNDISQLFNIAKLFGPTTVADEFGLDKSNQARFKSLLDQLEIKQEHASNTVDVQAPEEFDALVESLVTLGKAQAAQAMKMNRFREVGIAIHNFHDAYRGLPFNMDKFSKELSWRAKVAQFSWDDEDEFDFDLELGWDVEPNKQFADKLPNMFRGENGLTNICWIKSDVTSLERIMDGTSNTIMLLESRQAVPWTQPKDLTVLEAIKLVRGLDDGEKLIAVFYDASTFMIDNTFDHNELKALFTPNDGKTIDIWNR